MAIREVTCKSALAKSGLADYALNPYGGCAHNCAYCYASFMTRFSHHPEPWGQYVDAKVNAPDMLAKDLGRIAKKLGAAGHYSQNELESLRHPRVILSSVTDAYQPLEKKYGITRACLEVIASSKVPLEITLLTKSDLVVRDIDVLKDLSDVEAGMTVTTADDEVSRRYEPGASPVSKRFEALRKMTDAGLRTWAFIAPVLPYHSDSPEAIRALLRRLVDSGVSRIMVDRFNPYPAAVGRFNRVALPEAGHALKAYTTSPDSYLDNLRSVVRQAANEIGFGVRVLF